ncbi:tripartite ATP-independent transporter solute receptor, DctP family [Gracilibacillus orientalis]|uniref:Tripartite ATP-independent transporter solute receptor, DctP family n=1 Tax=Gracilibacillus orientalis TaxID=334253 RepID=A0A1I4GV37_9BACI|nr:TRAP transporter substrate-binding protein [Gracilibacillus orientalis]SFL33313.1 tripartite ATP-independent transporter solute receptor, DctP family [Gracilibacillus orientalis]
MKKIIQGVLFITLILFVVGCGANDSSGAAGDNDQEGQEQYTVRIAGGAVGPEHSLTKTFNFLKEELEEKSDGRFKVDLNVAGELGEDREIIEAIQMGEVHLASPSPAALGGFNDSVAILDMPFLFTNRETAYEVLDGEPGQMILDLLEESGIKGLGYFENGFRNVTNNLQPIESVEDFNDLSIRTMQNQTHISAWELLGANPTPLAFGELYSALQQGTVDGQENPFGLILANKFYEVQKYLTVTNHVYAPNVVITNNEFYDSLPDDLQTIFDDAISAAIDTNRELAQEEEVTARQALEDEGMEVYEFTPEQLEEMQEITLPVYEEFKDQIGADIVDKFLAASRE